MRRMDGVAERRECRGCTRPFEIFEEDLRYYRSFQIPPPTMCFSCRLQRRLCHFNRRNIYWRTCDKTGARILSMYSPDKPFPVYDRKIWYSDAWDALSYGRDFDFNRPFFDQFYELSCAVPHLPLAVAGELSNSEYSNDAAYLSNCYLVFDIGRSRGSMFVESATGVTDCVDCLSCLKCERCYEVHSCNECLNLKFSEFCRSCSDSWFLRDCVSCRDCIGCVNLRQKQYHVFNRQLTADQYAAFLCSRDLSDHRQLEASKREFLEFSRTQPLRGTRLRAAEDCLGDRLDRAQRAFLCFGGNELQDCRYCTDLLGGAKNCIDVHCWGDNTERCCDAIIVGEGSHNLLSCVWCWSSVSDLQYCMVCFFGCRDLFGCYGLQHKQYCILNKQYSKEEYLELRGRIVAHMQETGEWGEFFPSRFSLFGYNESLASSQFPLSREEVLARGWRWSDYECAPKTARLFEAREIPGRLADMPADLLQNAILCEVSGKPYRITEAELAFYRSFGVPLPRLHPEERHRRRLQARGPLALHETACRHCGKSMATTFLGNPPGVIMCEECYFAEVV